MQGADVLIAVDVGTSAPARPGSTCRARRWTRSGVPIRRTCRPRAGRAGRPALAVRRAVGPRRAGAVAGSARPGPARSPSPGSARAWSRGTGATCRSVRHYLPRQPGHGRSGLDAGEVRRPGAARAEPATCRPPSTSPRRFSGSARTSPVCSPRPGVSSSRPLRRARADRPRDDRLVDGGRDGPAGSAGPELGAGAARRPGPGRGHAARRRSLVEHRGEIRPKLARRSGSRPASRS